MATKQIRAKKGGQVGLNGEWYFGGQFLAQSPYTIKGELRDLSKKTEKKVRKEQVAPYKWEVPPTETARPIFMICGMWTKLVNNKMERCENVIEVRGEMVLGHHIDELIEMWNNGTYWIEKA